MTQQDREEPVAHRAIREGKHGRLHPRDMLQGVVDGKLFVPSMAMPTIDNARVTGWDPALLGKADGSRWLVAFTTQAGVSAWMEHQREYGFFFEVDTRWVLQALPAACGIVFNIGSEEQLEWSATGVAKYMHDVLGWA